MAMAARADELEGALREGAAQCAFALGLVSPDDPLTSTRVCAVAAGCCSATSAQCAVMRML
jgi:hypothetical protein